MTCATPDCSRAVHCKGMCRRCYCRANYSPERRRASHLRYHEANKQAMREYYAVNADRMIETAVEWGRANKDKKRESNRKWRHANPDKIAEYKRVSRPIICNRFVCGVTLRRTIE